MSLDDTLYSRTLDRIYCQVYAKLYDACYTNVDTDTCDYIKDATQYKIKVLLDRMEFAMYRHMHGVMI